MKLFIINSQKYQIFIYQVAVLDDNYCYIIIIEDFCFVIDPPNDEKIISIIEDIHNKPKFILNTHHHYDHRGGNTMLKKLYSSIIIAPKYEAHLFDSVDMPVKNNDSLSLGGLSCKVIHLPGHTLGHIAFFFPEIPMIFSGDVVFPVGCGRIFEGDCKMMYESIQKLKSLPLNTYIFCGHEYTLQNISFINSQIKPSSEFKNYSKEMSFLRKNNCSTVPSILSEEIKFNPFFSESEALQNITSTNSPKDCFCVLRKRKDTFYST